MCMPGPLGVQRALVESVLRQGCGGGVLQDFQMHQSKLSDRDQEQYDIVMELYGTSRMLLAGMPRDLLQRVCYNRLSGGLV